MHVRQPAVAGQFYPGQERQCRFEVEQYLDQASIFEEDHPVAIPETVLAGLVPHAGWICSGAVAAQVIQQLTGHGEIDTVVVFGAMHRVGARKAAVFARGAWETPLGRIDMDEELADKIITAGDQLEENPMAHQAEHSIEVQVPFIQYLSPQARILPIIVPPMISAREVGTTVSKQAKALGREVAFIGSTDLTHYGPRYGFTPEGTGPEALGWAKDVNDRRLLDLILELKEEEIVAEASAHHNACGPGAIAATVAAAKQRGASSATLLRHTSSREVLKDRYGDTKDAVGYAGVLFG
jgi:hypothetical protein